MQLVKTLATPGMMLGPTTFEEALPRMLLGADDVTYALLGGRVTLGWVFAQAECEAWAAALDAVGPGVSDELLARDPRIAEARAALEASVPAKIQAWLEAHPDELLGTG